MLTNEVVKNIKPGDEIPIRTYYGYQLQQVDHITPTGRVIMINGDKYGVNGQLMGEHYNRSFIMSMEDYNRAMEKERIKNIKKDLLSKIQYTRWGNMSIDQLNKVIDIIKEME